MDQQPQYDPSNTAQPRAGRADPDRIVQWLGDAHAMEMDAQTMLKTFASRLEHYPALKQRVEQHVGETQRQAQRLEERLQALGSSTPTLRDMAASAMAALHATGNALMSDEVIKGVGICYAFEHLEIASYRNLLFGAETAGDAATAQLCRDILPEEEAMARWLFDHQQTLVQQFLSLDATPGVTAKH